MRHILKTLAIALLAAGQLQAQTTLSLAQCLDMARQNNRTLQNAALDIEMAAHQKKEAYTQYFPQISAQVLAFYSFSKMMKGDGIIPEEIAGLGDAFAAYAGQPFSYSELNSGYSASLQVMQPLYAGGQIRTGNKLAELNQDVVKLQMQLKEKDVVQQVTDCYWQIATVKYNLLTLDAADAQMAEAMKTVSVYVDAGITSRNDLLKVSLRQHELESDRLRLDNAHHVLRLLLAQMVGMAGEDVDIDPGEMEPQQPADLFVLSSDAVASRVEMQLAEKNVEAQQMQVKMERGKNLPSVAVGVVGLQSGLGGLSKTVRDYYDEDRTNGLVLGTVSVPISDWWSGSHAIKRQKLKVQQARNDAEEAREQLQIDIESAWSDLTEAYDQIGVARKSVEQAQENLRMVSDQYRAGTIALSDLLDAETLNRQARTQLASALATYQTKRCAYELKTR